MKGFENEDDKGIDMGDETIEEVYVEETLDVEESKGEGYEQEMETIGGENVEEVQDPEKNDDIRHISSEDVNGTMKADDNSVEMEDDKIEEENMIEEMKDKSNKDSGEIGEKEEGEDLDFLLEGLDDELENY